MTRSDKGFTLIELLVVISIVSLLSSVVLVSVQSARNKAKNSIHINNLAQLKLALELYKDDNGEYPKTFLVNAKYLTHDTFRGPIWPTSCGLIDGVCFTLEWIPGIVSGGYIAKLPEYITADAHLSINNASPNTFSQNCNKKTPVYFYKSVSGAGYKIFVKCPEGGITKMNFKDPKRQTSAYAVCVNGPVGSLDANACADF